MQPFANKAVIVTGGAQGIGSGICLAFADEGAFVVIADLDAAAGTRLVEAIAQRGGKAVSVQADVTVSADVQRVVRRALDEAGQIDVLVNCAGGQPLDAYGPIDELAEGDWDRIIDLNLKSQFLMSKYSLPHMRQRRTGVIINIASVQGLQASARIPAYGAAKGGSLSLTRHMAIDYAGEGIRVVAICPGVTDAPSIRALAEQSGDPRGALQHYGALHPLGRIGRPDDIGQVAVFLASDKASFITGEYVCVDGGAMALGAWAGAGFGRREG